MRHLSRAWIPALLTATFVVCCAGAQTGRAQGYIFTPPVGWRLTAKPANGRAAWVHADNEPYHQNLSIIERPYSGTLDSLTVRTVAEVRGGLGNVQMGKAQHATVCGSHPSAYLTYTARVNGRPLLFEQMITVWGNMGFLATYTRLASQPSLSPARDSLTTMCGGLPAVGGPHNMRSGAPAAHPSPVASASPSPAAPTQPYSSAAPTVTPRLEP